MLNYSILEAKKRLYGLLLHKDTEELTENEVNVMYYLCLDKDIQEFLRENL